MKKMLVAGIVFGLLVLSLSGMASADSATVWYQSTNYEYNVYLNSSVGYSSAESSYEDNWIALSVHISAVAPGGDTQEVSLEVSVVVYSKTSSAIINEGDSTSLIINQPYSVKIMASQSNVPSDVHIDFDSSYNSGVNVTGDKYQGTQTDKFMRDCVEFAADQLIGFLLPWYVSLSYSTAKFLAEELSPTPVEDKQGVYGNGVAWETFLFDDNHVVWDDDSLITEGHAVYAASTHISWRIPENEMNEYTLHISAQNIMSSAKVSWSGGVRYIHKKNGASTGVTITIKDGRITSFNAHTQDINGPTTDFYTKDYTPSWVTNEYDYYAAPTLIVKATTMNNVPINYTVEWGDGKYSYAYSHASGEEYSFSHRYYPGPVGAVKYYTIKITAYTDDYYGGWSETKTIEITVHNNGKMDDNGGGGGCPFLYTYDGKWREENNVLVWAENATRPFLNTVVIIYLKQMK